MGNAYVDALHIRFGKGRTDADESFGWPKVGVIWRNCAMPLRSHDCDRHRVKSLLSVFAVALLAGCAAPRRAYVDQHPHLTADQRKVIVAGKLADRDPVAGLTREEIRLTMGADPEQAITINGEEAWVWLKRKPEPMSLMERAEQTGATGSGNSSNLPRDSNEPSKSKTNIRTTVFFEGNLATRVDVTEEPINP